MKKVLLPTFVWLIFPLTVSAQFFSGELSYKRTIIAKTSRFNVDSAMNAGFGSEMTYLITQHFYKNIYLKDGKEQYSYTYHDDTKRMFDDYADKDYITYRDSRKGNNAMIRSRIYKDSLREVAGHSCFMSETIYDSYIQKTYYATDLRIDPESYRGHLVGDWYNRIKEVDGALSLMSISEYADRIEIQEVVKITPRELKARDFELPRKKILAASFSALDKRVEVQATSLASQACYRKKLEEAPRGERYVAYVTFIVSEKGKVSNIEPYMKDNQGYYEIAKEIVTSCGIGFKPGEIDGKPVSSLVFFPVTFGK
jgi:hypothetical protein